MRNGKLTSTIDSLLVPLCTRTGHISLSAVVRKHFTVFYLSQSHYNVPCRGSARRDDSRRSAELDIAATRAAAVATEASEIPSPSAVRRQSFVGEARPAQLATAANFLGISISFQLHLRYENHSGRLSVFLVTWHLASVRCPL